MPGVEAPGARWDLRIETTLIRLLADNARACPNRVAMREKDLGIWQEITWAQVLDAALAYAAGLEQLGFRPGDALMVLGDNRARLYMGMIAAEMLDGCPMPLYPDCTPDEVARIARETGARFVLAEDQEQVDKVLGMPSADGEIAHILYDDSRGLAQYPRAVLNAWQDVHAAGVRRLQTEPALRASLIERARPESPAVFVFSSGTTGKAKGMVLTHRHLLAAARNGHRGGAFNFDEVILAYLPIGWLGDFGVTIAAGIALRFTINIPERQETVLHDLREIAPTFYLAAPRSWDNMLTTIQVGMEDSTWLKRRIYRFFMAAALAAERRKLEAGRPALRSRLLRALGEILVYGPIKDHLGLTRLRNAFTGGEAIGEDTFVFYRALGVKLRQVYGSTENSTFIALQDPDEVRLHTVGRPLPGVEVRISDEGEILVRADSVFDGYYRQDDATRAAFEDGWLRTGDAGYVEPDRQLVVLGRLSEVMHTAKGERYIPNYIENRLKFSPYIKDVAVLGSGRDTLAAIVCVDKESVGHWAERRGIAYMSYADLSQNDEVTALVAAAIMHVNGTLPDGLRLCRFVCLHKEFDADDGEITRTRKLRRNEVEKRYAPIIDAIYGGLRSVLMQAPVTYESGETGVTERELTVQEV